MDFLHLVTSNKGSQYIEDTVSSRIVGIDPGETTGICVFEGIKLIQPEQLNTKSVPEGALKVLQFVDSWKASFVIMEDYRVYAWKTRQHAWAGLHTPRLIGALEFGLYTRKIPLIVQSAGEGKAFCTNDKLQKWGFYQSNMRHANDAIRHVCHAHIFQKGL